jgi:hypothetical protein
LHYMEGLKQYFKDEAKKHAGDKSIPAGLLDIDSWTIVRTVLSVSAFPPCTQIGSHTQHTHARAHTTQHNTTTTILFFLAVP